MITDKEREDSTDIGKTLCQKTPMDQWENMTEVTFPKVNKEVNKATKLVNSAVALSCN